MKDRPWPVVAAVTALLVAAIGAGLAGTPQSSERGPRAVAALETAWERYLRATYVLDATFVRTAPDGRRLESPWRMARRPPDFLRTGLGASEGVVGGQRLRCLAAVSGVDEGCYPGTEPVDFEGSVQRQLANLHSYVEGDRPLYRVVAFQGGCFNLTLALRYPAPPFGRQALFCFDGPTGALAGVVVQRDEGADRVDPVSIRGSVTDADLEVPGDKGASVTSGPDTAEPAAPLPGEVASEAPGSESPGSDAPAPQ